VKIEKPTKDDLRLVREAREYWETGCSLESVHYNAALVVAFAALDMLDKVQLAKLGQTTHREG
jgi:hypothetical protein